MQQRTVFNVGQRVKGEYHSCTFTGTVCYERFHTMAHNIQLVSVKLDIPIVCWSKQDIRDTIQLEVDEYGEQYDRWGTTGKIEQETTP